MAKKSFFSKFTGGSKDDEDELIKNIDRELEEAVAAIQATEVETLDAKEVLSTSWGDAGDNLFIMDLKPIYEMIGGRAGRLAENLRDACTRVFSQHTTPPDRGDVKGNHFVMRFTGGDDETGFRSAAAIVNTVGSGILGSRFETMEVPELIIMADAASVTNPDGSLNSEMIEAEIKRGGIPMVAMDEPADDAPHWIKLLWKKKISGAEFYIDPAKPDSSAAAPPAKTTGASSQEKPIKNRGEDRRKAASFLHTNDRRKTLDRRGRGY